MHSIAAQRDGSGDLGVPHPRTPLAAHGFGLELRHEDSVVGGIVDLTQRLKQSADPGRLATAWSEPALGEVCP